jgi:hypothetical protein
MKPEWQRVLQDEGKTIKVIWSPNGNETLTRCMVRNQNKEIVGGFANNKINLMGFAQDIAMVYGTQLAFLVSPFNSSLRTGRYTMQANTTNGIKDISYEVQFELGLKSDEDKEEGIIQSWTGNTKDFSENRLIYILNEAALWPLKRKLSNIYIFII